MLQTGHFEGVKIAYCTKKDKSCLLSGVIHGTSYFCTCSNCDQKGKALSARGFEQHALKGRHETNNPNDHIIFSSSNLSLFEACHRLKGVKSKEIEEDVFENIKKAIGTGHEDERAYTGNGERAGTGNEEEKVDPILKRLELIEKRLELLENMQSQVTALEKSVDCIVGEMVRYQKLFGVLSETLGKFGNI